MKTLVNFKTLDVEVSFEHFPPEPPIKMYENGDGYPGSQEKIEISTIEYKGENITSFFEETGLIYQLEAELLTQINSEQDDRN